MFCPSCKDEFRAGFTRCASCNVDLVHDLSSVKAKAAPEPPVVPRRLVDYCGFFSMQEARHARDQLRQHRIHSEIVVREPPEVDWDAPAREEFWLRVDRSQYRQISAILGEVPEETGSSTETFSCSDCGHSVSKDELFCPQCGARFEEG